MEEINQEPKPENRWKTVGLNIAVLVVYTLACRFASDGIIIDAFLIAMHFFAGITTSIVLRKWEWVLSAFLVLVIGFSTCASFLTLSDMH
jgi:hypothetical protein